MKWQWHIQYAGKLEPGKIYIDDNRLCNVTISKVWGEISYSEPVCKEMVEEIMLDSTIPEDVKTDAMRRLMELQDV